MQIPVWKQLLPIFSDFSLMVIPQENGHLSVIRPSLISFRSNFYLFMCPCFCFMLLGLSNLLRILGDFCFSLWELLKTIPYNDFDLSLWCLAFFLPLSLPLFDSVGGAGGVLDPLLSRVDGYERICYLFPPFIISLYLPIIFNFFH